MRRVHDRGGWPDAGPIPREEHILEEWEKETDALARILASPRVGLLSIPELRDAIENLEPEEYENSLYYERWAKALEAHLVGKKVLTTADIDRQVAKSAGRSRPDPGEG